MRTFDVQGIEIHAPFDRTFTYVAEPRNLPKWTQAFGRVYDGRALMETPGGAVEISLVVESSRDHGTIDWIMGFPDGTTGRACSRLVKSGEDRSLYIFILMAPPAALEQIEGELDSQSRILREELERLKRVLEGHRPGRSASR